MQWSQLKKKVESLFADPVVGRVELHTTRYHKAHDQMGRAWITIDGHQIINMCSFAAEMALWEEATRLRQISGTTDFRNPDHQEGYYLAYDEAKTILKDRSIFDRWEFNQSLFRYLNLSAADILVSPDPIIRAIGMLDRRVGKRRLASMNMLNEYPLVRRLFDFRCETEKIIRPNE